MLNQQLKDLAHVRYGGGQTTAEQKAFSPKQVAQWFFNDRASDFYGFHNSKEDLAMTFEEAMMLSRFGVNHYTLFVNPVNSQIAHGYKNWISNERVKPRANFVVSQILPEAQDSVRQILNQTTPTKLCENRTLSDYYNTNCVSPYLPTANGHFIKQNSIGFDELELMRGATPIDMGRTQR